MAAITGTDFDDAITGTHDDDTIIGKSGNDKIWGNLGNDILEGRGGDDILVGGFGSDTLLGGRGNDVLLSRSDAGEPVIAHPTEGEDPNRFLDRFGADFDPIDMPHNDVLTGGLGADTFQFETFLGAKPKQLLGEGNIPLLPNGATDWMTIAMSKNSVAHYHWVDSLGDDTITDFNRDEGDTIKLVGHTIDVDRIEFDGTNSVIHLISHSSNTDPNAKLAHEDDLLGTITVLNAQVSMADITIDKGIFFGAFVKPTDPGVDAKEQPFQVDDTGVLPGMGFPGEEPPRMAMMTSDFMI